ncbi:MAG: succinic semialdehyde dehydrogenase [Actinomycetota bacterium]|nr:succinic semialdehyde dehydrogenase [Actinomycetota bacterium]
MSIAAGVDVEPALVRRLLAHAAVGANPKSIEVMAPFTGTTFYVLPISTEVDVAASVATARKAGRWWAQRPVQERARIFLKFHDLVLERRDEGLDIIQLETGKARRDAMEEILDVLIIARHYARDAARLMKPVRHRGALPILVGVQELRHPKGVVGIISPWNYPLTLAASDAIPALLAGNAVVLKPDSKTSMTALWVVDLMIEAGVPESVIRVVTGAGQDVGPMVIDRVDYVMFTGSTQIGREVARRCGERLIGCSLELGGKNAMIIRADADLERAAEIAVRACFANAGQLCVSIERMYIHEEVMQPFLDLFLPRVAKMRMIAELGWGADMGSLISQGQLDRVQAHLADAVAHGAQVLVGGQARPEVGPYYFEPTVLAGVTEDMELCRDETFGPVVAVYPVSSDEQAIAMANDTVYGLNASVLTRDTYVGNKIAAQLKAGTVNVNEGYAPAWGSVRAPMGGMGDSGLGRRHGAEGFLQYTEAQTIATQRALGFGAPFGWSNERWGGTLVAALEAMKKFGFK